MKILFLADGRSPIAINWITYFIEKGHQAHLVSTFPCQSLPGLATLDTVSVGLSSLAGSAKTGQARSKKGILGATSAQMRTVARHWLAPLTLPAAARNLIRILDDIQPDLVHAMRIPYEGMLVALANPRAPVLISVWGNDFTLHAPANRWMSHYTRLAMERADALHSDCRRDQREARQWGFSSEKPAVVLPGGGGVQLDIFFPSAGDLSAQEPLVINPRGIRAYLRTDTFFQAAAIILERMPQVRFICPAMAGEIESQTWIDRLNLTGKVDLLPRQSRQEMAELFRKAQIVVSPSTHDGTPNTLLEAMACGCFPVAGDLESIREWIVPPGNGLLVDPADPVALAEAVILALEDSNLRENARQVNLALIREQAEYTQVMNTAEQFYTSLIA